MAISRTQLIQKVRNRLGEPMVRVELCDSQISEHIDYARQKWIKWAIGNATQETYFTVLLQAGKTLYDLPAGVVEVVEYNDKPISSGGINTLFTIDNWMFSNGFYGNAFYGGYDLISYHLVLDFLTTLGKYKATPYNWKYHKSTNQLEINPAPPQNESLIYVMGKDPETGLPKEYVFDSPGFIMLRTYMVEGSTLPYYRPEWTDILKEVRTIVEDRVVTTSEATNKSLLLKHTPMLDYSDKFDYNVPEDMKLTFNGYETKKYADWDQLETNRRVVIWEGMGLDTGGLTAGDRVVISYPVLFESEYYPDEWTDVTMTSNEVEQVTLNQNHIDRGQYRVTWPIWDDNIKVSVGTTTYELDILTLSQDFKVDDNDNRIVTWKDLGLDGTLTAGDTMVITYTGIRSKRPNNQKASKSVVRQYKTRIENRTITADEIINKELILEEDVVVGDGMKFSLGGFDRVYGIDFTLSASNTVSWDTLGLDGVIVENDEVVITYTSANYFEREVEEKMYDEDWILDYVTAMSKISLGLIRRKFASFNSMGNQGISLDGDSLLSEGNSEKEYLEQTLRDEEAFEGYGITTGLM